MANTIKHKRGSGSNPAASSLSVGELAIRTDTGVVFTKKDDGTVAEIAGGGDTDLGVSTTSTAVTVTSSTGNNATISEASGSAAGVMSVAHHDKLDGIESGATADQTKSDIDALGIDADTVDGVEASSFLRSDAADTKTSGDLSFSDSVKAKFGNSSDLQIYHDSTYSYIQNNFNDLILENTVNNRHIFLKSDDSSGGSAVYIKCDGSDGAVKLYHYGQQKLNTKSDGIDVGGELQCDSLDVDGVADISGNVTLHANLDLQDNDQIRLGSSDDLKLYHDGTDGLIVNDTNALVLKNNANDASIYLQTDNGSGGTTNYIRCNGSTGDVILYQYGNQKLQTFSSGVDITGELQCDSLDVDGAADITGTVTLHGNLDLQDSDKILLGAGDDLEIFHDGSNSYVKDNGTGSLILETNGTSVDIKHGGEYCARFREDADVELYFNNSKKFETKSDGVDIIGELQCDTLDVDGNGDIAGQLTVNRLVVDDDGSSGPTVQIRTDDQSPWAVQISNDSWSSGSNRGLLAYQANDGNFYTRLQGVSNNWEAFYLQQSNGSTTNTAIEITLNREVALRYQNNQKLITKSDGVDITGELQCDSLDVDGSANVTGTIDINGDIRHNGDVNCLFGFPSNDTFRISTGGTERFRITSTGAIAIEGSSNYGSSGQVLTSNGNDAPTWQDGGGTVASGCVYENSQTISANYSVTSGKNAMSAGPITIASGVTVTVTSGSTYTIV